MTNIEEEIEKLPEDKRKRLETVMVDLLEYDKHWCARHGIDYLHPNIAEARKKVYELYFKDKPSN